MITRRNKLFLVPFSWITREKLKIEFPALNKKWVDPQESDVKRTLSLQVGGE